MFGLSGGIVGVRTRLDVFGIVVLAVAYVDAGTELLQFRPTEKLA